MKNLKFIATHTDNPTLDNEKLTRDNSYSYALHADFGSCDYDIEDCDFTSYQQSAIGIGTWDTSNEGGIRLKNCRLFRKGNEGTLDNGGFIVHTNPKSNQETNGIWQRFSMNNCYVEVEYGNTFANISNSANNNRYDYDFSNNTFYSTNNISNISINNISINTKSHNNNIEQLNYRI